ncbi:unnamed protein product [Linum tenue]|uniref:Hpc2-related domain-containing protein n=1 Tax=Linum tenue TaxID=586396 RepID=A0AAV0RWC6_9ROSI|nr:unnamed protein product [Linum tenue]
MGKDSSDDEDLKDAPDDDQYDTEDSFIDDAELDEYFEVDNSAIKHDGFFVNRGKLERISGGYKEDVKPHDLSGTSSKKKYDESKLCLDPSSTSTTKTSNADINCPQKRWFHVRSKGSILEKAIRELERMVAESRPPAIDNQDGDASSQAIKRRLPREIKLKLAKVARLAASQGKMSKDLINRLMSILGHLIQLRTLKVSVGILINSSSSEKLKIMVNSGLSAKQEKDDKFQVIKKEVAEMIKTRVPALESKAMEQQAGASDDFQDLNSENKGVVKRKFSMDAALEDKVCDLYDLFVDGLDEDAGPHVRKLYMELVGLWPSGAMDNHGIKRAICRAKDRRRAIYSRNKEEEKIRGKQLMPARPEEAVRPGPSTASQTQTQTQMQQHARERSTSDTGGGPVLALASKPMSGLSAITQGTSSSVLASAHNPERPKQDRAKGSVSMEETKAGFAAGEGVPLKKKVKRKPEAELDQTHLRPEKTYLQSSDERHKSVKAAPVVSQKLSLQSAVLPPPHSFEQ